MTIEELQRRLGHTFENPALLEKALTHSSFSHEHGDAHNERLEFLGDAILQASITLALIERFPLKREGVLSRLRAQLVSTHTLAEIGMELQLGPLLRLGKGEEKTGGRTKPSLLADATEALLGAVFLDAGFEACRVVVLDWMTARIDLLDDEPTEEAGRDPRSALQELTQERWRITPDYEVVGREGPAHAPTFEVVVRVDGDEVGRARGRSKREAAAEAASEALVRLEDP